MVLRPLARGDERELLRIHRTPEVARWWDLPDEGFPWTDDPATTRWTIEVDGAVAGLIQFYEELDPQYRHAAIDLFLDPALHGRGIGTEAVRRVVRHLIEERGHHRITTDPAAANARAIRVYEKVGFRRVGVMRRYERDVGGGGWHDGLLMELLADEEDPRDRGERRARSGAPRASPLRRVSPVIAQLSDIHLGGARYDEELLDAAIRELNGTGPDLVAIAGDVTDEGYPDQYQAARAKLDELECANVVVVPGNHDARHVGYLYFEEAFGARDRRLRLDLAGHETALVAVDSSKPDIDQGEIGREHYGWIAEGFAGEPALRIFLCHHHLMPIPGTGRERNQVLDAGDALSLLRRVGVDLVLGGHRHVPYVWPVAGMLLVHSGTASTLRTRAFPRPAYNLIEIDADRISVRLRVPGGGEESLGSFPRRWPAELAAANGGPAVTALRGPVLADD